MFTSAQPQTFNPADTLSHIASADQRLASPAVSLAGRMQPSASSRSLGNQYSPKMGGKTKQLVGSERNTTGHRAGSLRRLTTHEASKSRLASSSSSEPTDDVSNSRSCQSDDVSSEETDDDDDSTEDTYDNCGFERPTNVGSFQQMAIQTASRASVGAGNENRRTCHEVLFAVADLHMNVVASLTSSSSNNLGTTQVCIWDFEVFNLVGTCVAPLGRGVVVPGGAASFSPETAHSSGNTEDPSSRFERFTGVAFLSPYPLLAGCTSHCTVHLWKIPDCTIVYTLEAKSQPGVFVTEPKGDIPASNLSAPSSLAESHTKPPINVIKASVCSSGRHPHLADDGSEDTNAPQREDFNVVVAGGTDGGHVVFWGLRENFFHALDCQRVPPVRRLTLQPTSTRPRGSQLDRSQEIAAHVADFHVRRQA